MMCSMGPMSALTRADIHTMLNTPPTRGLLLSAMEVCSWSCLCGLCGLCVLLMLPLEPAAFQLPGAQWGEQVARVLCRRRLRRSRGACVARQRDARRVTCRGASVLGQ